MVEGIQSHLRLAGPAEWGRGVGRQQAGVWVGSGKQRVGAGARGRRAQGSHAAWNLATAHLQDNGNNTRQLLMAVRLSVGTTSRAQRLSPAHTTRRMKQDTISPPAEGLHQSGVNLLAVLAPILELL